MNKFKRGDGVIAIAGPYKGEVGTVGTIFNTSNLALIMFNGSNYGTPVSSCNLRKLTKLDKALK